MFSMRIVTTSHYQAKPIPGLDTTHSEFQNTAVKRVPVLRIFGSTPAGQKTCMHIHGVFPYLYVPYDGTQPAEHYLRQFAASLDKALNIANRSTNSNFQHVYKISLVSGIPMYGYHPQEEHFLKIYLFNPNNVRKAADLLLGGAVMNKPFQPYESHLPYALQLFIDYNLYGMNLINVAALKFRKKAEDDKTDNKGKNKSVDTSHKDTATTDTSLLGVSSSASSSTHSSPVDFIWHKENIPSELWLPGSIERQSTCELEVDVVAADITNRHELASNIGANPGLAALWEDEKQRRRDAGESSQLEPDSSQERAGVMPSDSEKELVKRFLDIVKQQQVFRNSQSDDSLPSQPSQPASQLESHVSREDSIAGSQSTVILDGSDDDEDGDAMEGDGEHLPIVNMKSIEKVVSCSQSFSRRSSKRDMPDTQDQSVVGILAALLEESGPPSSQLASLEDQDSILNQSIILDKEEENNEEEETLLMSQIINTEDTDAQETRLDFDVKDLEVDPWDRDKDADIIMNTDDDDDDSGDEVDILPQFDGASDKMPGSQKKSDQSQIPNTVSQNSSTLQGSADTSQNQVSETSLVSRPDVNWRAGTTGRVMGNSQSFPAGSGSWTQQGWPQQSGSAGGSWHGQSPTWSQQQHYQNWPQHQQQMPSTFSSQQAPFHSPSPATSFQSPPHNPYSSPTHQQTYQTPSPSASHHQYQYPPYQSPTSSQPYQQPYQSPSQHPYQSPGSSQTFHSTQSYHSSSSSQPYQSPSTSQPFSPLGTTSQPYQIPASNKQYMSPPGNQPYPSATVSQPYQSPQGNSGYQPTSGQIYPSPYQSPPQSHHSSPQQPYPPPYQSPVHGGYPSHSSWNPQSYPGYYQGLTGSQGTGSSGKHSGGSAQSLQPDTSLGQPGNSSSSVPNSFQSQDLQQHQQISTGLQKQQLIDVNISKKLPSSHNMIGPETQGGQSSDISQPQKKKGGKKRKDSATSGGFKSPRSPCLSPAAFAISKSPYEIIQQNTPASCSQSNIDIPSLASAASLSWTKSQDHVGSPHVSAEDSSNSAIISSSKLLESTSFTKISTLEFRPNVASYSVAPVSIESSTSKSAVPLNTPSMTAVKVEASTSTPMIQQLLMEEPARMNIRKEDREAVMKKPMANPTSAKPKRKYTRKTDPSVRKPGRPRSMSLSSPAPPAVGYCGYSQPVMNLPMAGRPEKSHTIPLPFSCESRMPAPMQNYAWQRQWKQQSFSPSGPWQQQQQQWGMNEWQGYYNLEESSLSGEIDGCNSGPITSRLQQRSLSADTIQSPVFEKNSQPVQIPPFPDNQIALQNSSADISQMCVNRESANDKSSLSSLFQLVSDVGSEDIDWENASSAVVPNLFPNSSESETPKSTPPSDINQGSPLVKDFITLETPCKQDFESAEKANSDTAGMTSSEELDRTDFDLSCDLKPRNLIRSFSLGSGHPRLGKQSRLKKLGLLHTQSTDLGSVSGPVESNPAYTYTFHVPTPVFKKLKFFRSVESRKHNIKVVRMHPMDARRYSLLKIGREIVKTVKLTEVDFAKHNVILHSPYLFVSADGSSNRVNLDIPVVSVDRRSGDSGSEDCSLSKFDTDFPPNKVAPPSFFNASQVSASLTRAASTVTRGSPVGSDWMRQYTGQQPANYNGGFSPGSQQGTCSPQQTGVSPQRSSFPFSQQQREGGLNTSGHQHLPQSNMDRHFNSQPSEDSSGISFQQVSQKGSSFYPHTTPSSIQPQGNYYTNQQGMYMNHTPFPQQHSYYQQQYHQQQQQPYQLQQQFPQQQPQTGYNGSNSEPKNGLRSPGQHGLISKIDSGRVHGHSGDQETEHGMNITETFPFNTRVNAQRMDNHAEHMANCAATQNAGVCAISHSPALEHPKSTSHNINSDDDTYLSTHIKESSNVNCFDENHDICTRKARWLSLKKAEGFHCHSLEDPVNSSDETKNNHVDHRNQSILDKDVLECCLKVIPSNPGHFTNSKHHGLKTSLNVEHGQRRGKTSWRKNVKSLRLKIPVPRSNQNPRDFGGIRNSLDHSERDSVTSSQKESDIDECVTESRDVSPSCRSVRSTSVEECTKSIIGGRQSPRQAKLRSFYSKNVYTVKPKKKRRKRQKPLVEGVHYIVIGKFRGYRAMLVKVKKLNLSSTERVKADLFEEQAAKDIVRVVSPVSYVVDSVYDGDSKPLDYPNSNTSAGQNDVETKYISLDCDTSPHEFGQGAASTSVTYHRASRGRSLLHGKFRSAHGVSRKQRDTLKDVSIANPIRNELESKNLMTGPTSGGVHGKPTSGASENITHCSYFAHDEFFSKFKENFIKHNKAKELSTDTVTGGQENTFFEGIRGSSFHNFQQKFLANIKKLRSNDYSSSSDDEDDVLDETVLKEKFGIPRVLVTCRARSKLTAYETVKPRHNTTESDLWINQPTINGKVGTFSQFFVEREFHFDNPEASENGKEKGCSFTMEQGSSTTEDAALSSEDKRTLNSDGNSQCFINQKGTFQRSVEVMADGQSVTDANNVTCEEVPKQEVNNIGSKLETEVEEISVDQHSSFGKTTSYSTTNSDSMRDNEEKEDYLKSQMAFFEDISSDSDSSDTIIMDNFVGKESASPDSPTSFDSLLPVSGSSPGKVITPLSVISAPCTKTGPHLESVTGLQKDALSEDKCVAFSNIHESYDPAEHSEMFSCDLTYGTHDHTKPHFSTNENEIGVPSQTPVSSTSQLSEFQTEEYSAQIEDNVLKLTDKTDVLNESDDATIELDMSLDASSKDSNKNCSEQPHSSKASDQGESKLMHKSVDSDNYLDTSVLSSSSHRHKKHGKGLKKSKRDKGSKLVNRRLWMNDGNSSSNDVESYTFSHNKQLRQRKQTLYTYYTDILESTEDDSSDSSDEDFNNRTSQRKGSKSYRKHKGAGFKDKQIRKIPQVSVDVGKSARSGHRVHPSRGKKKKVSGGDKLLNSLSLLHMATLANLTEVQSDPLDGPSVSARTSQAENEHTLQYSDMANNDHNITFTPSLEHMSFISPQKSDEFTGSPPVACSPNDKNRWKQSRGGNHRSEDIAVSRRLLNSQRLTTLKPGCNGASNLGSKPLPFSRLMSNSASPVPSNFSFNHISDFSLRPESTNQYEDVGTSNTLQLLETRRAQVNCASFSMKDILKLTTPDDSMDSDSKDSAALVRPPEPKRAQVKSTTLSMSDILKLTSADKSMETENSQTSHSIFSLLSNPDPYSTQSSHKKLEVTDFPVSHPNSELPCEEIAASYSTQQNADLFNPSLKTQEKTTAVSDTVFEQVTQIKSSSQLPVETSETSQSLLCQVTDFSKSISHTPEKCIDELSQPEKNDYSGTQPVSCLTSQGKSSDITSQEASEKKAQIKSASLSVNELMRINSSDNNSASDTDIKKCKKTQFSSNMLSEARISSTDTNFSHHSNHSTSKEITHELPAPSLLKLNSSHISEQLSPSSSLTSSDVVMETPNCTSASLENLSHLALEAQSSHLALEAQSTSFDVQQQRKEDSEKLDEICELASTPIAVTIPHIAGIEDSSAGSEERSSGLDCISQTVCAQRSPQLNVVETFASSVFEIPRISITCDETAVIKKFEFSHPETQLAIIEDTTDAKLKNVVTELKPLHPLQIPPYSFIGHGFGSQAGHLHSSLNPSLYYPYCWQWPVHTPGSDPAVSPLNLCTIQKSPNTYSPITPTSPISPGYLSHLHSVAASGMSPPLKKAKPLWYPWLTVDSARNRSEPKVSVPRQRNYNSCDFKAENLKNSSVSNDISSHQKDVEQTTVSVAPENICRELTLKEPWTNKHDAKINDEVQTNCFSRIADILSSSAHMPSSVKINSNKLSSWRNRADTLHEQGNNSISAGDTDSMAETNVRVSSPNTSKMVDSQQNTIFRNVNECQRVPSDVYWSGDTATAGASCGSRQNKSQHHRQFSNEVNKKIFWNSNFKKTNKSHGEDMSKAAVCKSEHDWAKDVEKKQIGHFGLSSPVNSSSPSRVDIGCVGLRDRLITKLIKGDDLEYHHQQPTEASRGKKRPDSSQKRSGNILNTNQSTKVRPLQKSDRGEKPDNEGENNNNHKDRKVEEGPTCEHGRNMTLCPVKPPPGWSTVEESLCVLGLNSVQPPVAFCSNPEDLPERPVEHWGRVLNVESKRLCELSPFITSRHIIGIKIWRSQSLSSSKLLASQPQGRPLWERLEQEPHLRFLLAGECLVVVSPVCTPPSRASVKIWLQNKMAAIRDAKSVQPSPLKTQANESCTAVDDVKDKEQRKFDNRFEIHAQHPDLISVDVHKRKEEEKRHDICISETVSSQVSSSEGDSSALLDTDLDISCTPTTTPALHISSTQFFVLPLPTHSSARSQESHHTSPRSVSKPQRKRKLRFADDTSEDVPEETSPTDSHTLDEHFKKTKKRHTGVETQDSKQEISLLSYTVASSTPLKHSIEGLLDLAYTPVRSPLENAKQSSPEMALKTSDNFQETTDNPQTPMLRHVSTNTESLLKKRILTSQTQRQVSILGLNEVSQIEGPTPKNSFGFKVMQTNMQDSKALHKYQYVTVLSIELHMETRGDLRPDPEFDAVHALFYSVLNDIPPEKGMRSITGVIVVDLDSWNKVSERKKKEEISVDTSGTESSTPPSIPQSAATKDSSGVTDQMLPASSAKLTPNVSGQAGTSTSYHIPTSSPKPQTSQPAPSVPSSGKGKGKGKSVSVSPVSGTATDALLEKCGIEGLEVTYVKDEMNLINTFTELVAQLDPDILVGFEIQMLSWGYLLQRAAHLNVDLCSRISRVQEAKNDNRFSAEKDEWGADHMSEIHVAGRIVLNLWRILRYEITLNVYSFENVAYHVLHRRIPLYSFRCLSKWYSHKTHLHKWRVFEHYLLRVKGQLEIIDQLDLIGKTSEFARVFGLEFFDVLARGSQIRVESMMLRLAKPMNFVPISPSVNQRARQRAPECIQLNLEPESKYYTSPVAVLDFQSLYPSIMIAYNYCFTTCLGRLDFIEKAHEGPIEFGCTSLNLSSATLKKIRDHVTVSPNGVAFLKSSVRRGVLPIMVEEILNTRLMVKKSMKAYKNDKILSRMLDARQLGLKLIANVTYGYTGANFSGRMPCIEVGDSIVRKARESLERAIELVRTTPKWGAHVVYGDTDSMFIHFPGRSKDEAFVLAQEIADTVTAMFPKPIKLRFEKVYLPCVLQTKKRYVGFMYETQDQKEPVYDAKGIETVRRDSCSAVSKILERSIKVLFTTHDLSRVKAYVTRQLHKLLEGKVSIIDLIFAKEYRGIVGYKPGACVPALEIARRRLRLDRRSEPRVGERVPYVIVHGSPGLPLIQLVKEPAELIADTSLRLNASYYITKQILPPLDRIFSLIGISVFKWYLDMPKVVRVGPMIGAAPSNKQGTISQFFATTNCPVCDAQTKHLICEQCRRDPQLVVFMLTTKIQDWEKTYCNLAQVCDTCQGAQDCEQVCVSIDCPIMFRRIIARQELVRADNLQEVLTKYLQF